MSEVVGIDLGTTNTVVGALRGGQASALADEAGRTLIPSVVSFHPNGNVLVGRPAKERRIIDPKSTIFSVKRLIGRSWDTEEVRRARSRLPFQMREGPGQAALIAVRGETYTLPEISAFVLRKARGVAEAALGGPVERAVITVPANFNDLQRAATKVAARVAGLEVLRILNEPTAAALAYGYGKSSSERIAVYDFGGGTFDVTLLDLSNNVFEVLATAGNTFLGGDDLDVAIAERMAEQFLQEHRYDPRADPVAFDRFRLAAEDIKRTLSEEDIATAVVREVTHGAGGKSIDLVFEMTRGEFELLAAPIVDQTFDVCRDALDVARVTVGDLDQVLLVGGSTRIPLVQRRVEEFFRRAGQSHLSADEVVAMGAAIQASALAGTERRKSAIPPPPAPARRASTEPGVGRGTLLTGSARPPEAGVGRLRLSSMVEAEEPGPSPDTKPFEPRRPAATRPGLQPPDVTLAEAGTPTTLMGLGNRGRTKTGAGLGPDATAAGAGEASSALDEITHRVLESADDDEPTAAGRSKLPSAPRFDSAPPISVDELVEPDETPELDESSLPLPEIPDDVPTRVGATPLVQPPPVSVPAPDPSAYVSPSVAFRALSVPAPVLVDVTPLTLSVETVGGYCDALIARNTPVPCDRTRTFATASDNQTTVRVRVSQGESSRFSENTLLGELELTELRPAPRGSVEIAVTFALDTNGMLNVSARDLATDRATQAQLVLVGLPEPQQIAGLVARHAAHRAG